MALGEGASQRRTPVSIRAKADQLGRIIKVRPARIVLPFELGHIHQYFLGSSVARQR
jgi:hypothetical protein